MNLLVTGAWNCTEAQLNMLSQMGHNVVFHKIENEPLPCDYGWAEGVICNGLFLHHDIQKFRSLKYIQLTSAGFDRVPMDYVKAHNIEIHNARGVYSIPMAEFAICGVLQLYKQSEFFANNQKNHLWQKHRGLLEIYGKTVCIIGCGNVGTECAKRFKAFGTKILGVDIANPNNELFDDYYHIDNIKYALLKADITILTLPLTNETKSMFNSEMFSCFKENAVLVNIARGALINQDDLISVLKANKLYGAVLDVFEEEPLPPDNELWDMPNVIITPHNSFVGEGNSERISKLLFTNIEKGRHYE